MPYQKMKKEEMKEVYHMILEEMNLERDNSQNRLMLSDFKKLGKEAVKRIQKKCGVKDKRKLKRIFEKFLNSNGEIDKLKKSGKVSPYLNIEIRMCELLGAINGDKHYNKKTNFFKLNEQYDLKLPKSNGYLQNYRRRHKECGGKTCKFVSIDMSLDNSPFSTSCESSLKGSHLNDQDYNICCSNDSFVSFEFPISTSEDFKTMFGEESVEDFKMDALEDFDHVLRF